MKTAISLLAFLLVACGTAASGGCPSSLPGDVGGLGTGCGTGGHLAERIATDLRTYAPGAPIAITVTATNTSTEACVAPTACPPLRVAVEDSSGRQVWSPPNQPQVCPALARLLLPGESVSYVVRTDGLTLPTGVYSATGPQPETAAAYGRSYFTVC